MYSVDKNRILWRKVEDEVVILDIDSGYYYTLSETGVIIWEMLVDGKSPDEISSRIAEDYDVDKARAQADIKGILKNLEAENLVQVRKRDKK